MYGVCFIGKGENFGGIRIEALTRKVMMSCAHKVQKEIRNLGWRYNQVKFL